uniref:YqaJ viral recombinase domain-containing protein n=1 Tax=Amphiprion percula TaxID=161767 RepID=A0A3P8TT64_AMPPE
MQNQKTGQKSTGSSSAQKLVLPQVRYHPSIQMASGGARAKTTNSTRTSQTQRTRSGAAGPLQTRTNAQVVQKNQDAVKPRPSGRRKQKPAADPEPPQKSAVDPEPPQKSAVDPEPPQRLAAAPEPPQKSAVDPEPPQKSAVDPEPPQKSAVDPEPPQKSAVNPEPPQRLAADPEPPQKPAADPEPQASDRTAPSPEQFPVGVGEHLDRRVVEQVEVLTRGQRTNPDWFSWRKNRITASVAHRIANCRFVNGKSKTPPASYLAAITGEGPRVQTRAMSWGIDMEAKVIRRYQELKSRALGRPVSVQDCGLFIDAQRPWLAASPDGIVIDSWNGQRLLCLEVKCPYKHRDRRVEDACRDDPAFCLEVLDEDGQRPGGPPRYRLKSTHSYFTQIQVQLWVSGLQEADLVVFTLKETAVVPVHFDEEIWDQTLSRLAMFYRDAVQPHLEAAAAQRPEL